MEQKYVKDKRTGVVLNISGTYEDYQRARKSANALAKSEKEVKVTKTEVSVMKDEIKELKELVQKLLQDKKT